MIAKTKYYYYITWESRAYPHDGRHTEIVSGVDEQDAWRELIRLHDRISPRIIKIEKIEGWEWKDNTDYSIGYL